MILVFGEMIPRIAILGVAMAILALSATAQKASGEAGQVTAVAGPPGSVILMRGAQSYPLQANDLLFAGDRIVTRSGGTLEFLVGTCARVLGPIASIVVDDLVCSAVPTLLTSTQPDVTVAAAADSPRTKEGSAQNLDISTLLVREGLAAPAAASGAMGARD